MPEEQKPATPTSEPPEDPAIDEISEAFAEARRILDRTNRMMARIPPPFRDPAPSAPPA